MTATDPFNPPQRSSRYLLARLWRDWTPPHRLSLLLILLLMVVVAGATGLYPLLIERAYALFDAGEADNLLIVPLAVIGLTAIKGAGMYAQNVLTQQVVLRIVLALQNAVYGHLLSLDLARVQAVAPGGLIARLTTAMGLVREGLSRIMQGVVDLLTVLALLASMLWLDWLLTLIVLAIYPIAALPVVKIGKRMRRAATDTQAGWGQVSSALGESFEGLRMVKAYCLESYESKRMQGGFQAVYEALMRLVRGRSAVDPLLEVLGGLAVAGVMAFVGLRIANGESSVGAFTAFIAALLIAARHVRALGTLNAVLQEALSALDRGFAILDAEPAIRDKPDAKPLPDGPGRLDLRDVSFSYRDDVPALSQISFAVDPGKTVALVGPSGAGKSTLINLIPRLYDASTGAVLIDGVDIAECSLASVRCASALVNQDAVLFDDSVRANIAFGRLDAPEDEIIAAARAADAMGFIEKLPEGLDTRVGPHGNQLSGGQRQRIALARALLRAPRILLLDEATSALDSATEARVQAALERLREGRTTLVIAHRLATVQSADCIHVLDQGRIVESGRHAELVAKGGLYAELLSSQVFRGE